MGGERRRGSTPPRSTPTRCSNRTPPPASALSSPCWAARPASPPKRPCALSCSRRWPAETTWSSRTDSGTGPRNSAGADGKGPESGCRRSCRVKRLYCGVRA
jgi:hypothetical protein